MKVFFSFVVSLIALSALGCEPAATDDELTNMCKTLSNVRGEAKAPVAAELKAKVEQDFTTKETNLLAWKAKDMRGWDEELEAKIASLNSDDEESEDDAEDDNSEPLTKASLKKMYAKKKEIGAKQFDDDLAKLATAKKEALAAVEGIVKEAQTEFDSKINECIEAAKKDGVSQSLAQCRIAAPDKDTYWNKCK